MSYYYRKQSKDNYENDIRKKIKLILFIHH